MIGRIWSGSVPLEKAEEYIRYQHEVGPPGYVAIPGNRGVCMLGRPVDQQYQVMMFTLWDSMQAIRTFAGDPVDKARYYDRDFDYLVQPPEKVDHFEVLEVRNLALQSIKPGRPRQQ